MLPAVCGGRCYLARVRVRVGVRDRVRGRVGARVRIRARVRARLGRAWCHPAPCEARPPSAGYHPLLVRPTVPGVLAPG